MPELKDLELTGHVSQQSDSNLEHALSPSAAHSSPSTTPHPYNLDFPTLEDDGSVSDITSLQSPPQGHRTPPAALSALGYQAMADRGNASESEGSLADAYDMIDHDDLSEISNDDHDTASITSNEQEHEGQLTPEMEDSDEEVEAELEEDGEVEDTTHSTIEARSQSPSESVVMVEPSPVTKQVKAENELLDSYMSEDLETPRQSVMPFPPSITATTRLPESKVSFKVDQNPSHILFVSNRDTPHSEMDTIISRIMAGMQSPLSDNTTTNDHKVIRLPPTPTGLSPASATVVCGQDSVSATVQHCVGAEVRYGGDENESYGLRILDHDGLHSTWLNFKEQGKIGALDPEGLRSTWSTVGPHGEIEAHKPDLVVFHIMDYEDEVQFRHVFEAVIRMKVPTLIILGKNVSNDEEFCSHPWLRGACHSEDFFAMDRAQLIQAMSTMSQKNKSKDANVVKTKKGQDVSIVKVLLKALPALLLVFMIQFATSRSQVVDIPAQREALRTSLDMLATPNMPNISTADMGHLLPDIPATCYRKTWNGGQRLLNTPECTVQPRFLALQPNHMVLSLSGVNSAYPRVLSTKVSKTDGRNVSFNQTQLINGVSMVTFDANEAYDTVIMNTITEKPAYNITASYYYGQRFLQRKTYEKAGNEVSKIVGNDLAIMGKTVQKINNLVSTEVTASVQATRNVTNQLAKFMGRELQVVSRELQVFGKTANAMLNKAGRANEEFAKTLGKEFVMIRKDLVKFTKDLSVSVKSTAEAAKSNTKALIQSPLAVSRERVQKLKQALQRQEKGLRTTAAKAVAKKELAAKRAANQHKAQQIVKRQLQLKSEQKVKLEARLQAAKQHRQKLQNERRVPVAEQRR